MDFDEECERELELEQEEEERQGKEIKPEKPHPEADWDYSLAIDGQPLAATRASNAVMQASDASDTSAAVSKYLSPPTAAIRWSKASAGMLYFSKNFISSVAHSRAMSRQPLDEYLRPIDAFLVLRDGVVLVRPVGSRSKRNLGVCLET